MKLEANLFAQQLETQAVNHQSQPDTPSTKYHRAALDGYIDMLCDASKRDSNLPNADDGLTPTLLAAQNGHLDALRILVGRGGDPEKTAADGSCALHLAATRGHLNCVSFLVNFGVNMWSLDNDLRTAKDVAAIEQRKEVLDFLDQMMAKQSALATRNVQKLKEKAKMAAERRIKHLRKAQLKAIKQMEKDERYLMKLSHNRRLLKAAHSISDIKLVGRQQPLNGVGQPINYLLAQQQPSTEMNGCGSSHSSMSRLSGPPGLANFINHKLQMDLLKRSKQQTTTAAGSRLLSRRSVAGSTTTDESSAYSTSSVSSCLSAGSTSPKRPKYSDLVAVNGAELARWQQTKIKRKPAATITTEQQSLKSSSTVSTIGTRLWGIGGVSRKVQLRRLLKAGAQSSSDLTTSGISDAANDHRVSISNAAYASSTSVDSVCEKLCNVQPTIKLKLNATESQALRESSQYNKKWMHNSTMARAVSEPDFGAALRSGGRDEEDCDFGQEDDREDEVESVVVTDTKPPDEGLEEATGSAANQCHNKGTSGLTPKQHQSDKDDSQQQLLNQCLSQLKLRHEALTVRNQVNEFCETGGQIVKPSKMGAFIKTTGDKRRPQITSGPVFGNSDELIQHQLNAGKLPLKPSLIKQHQQSKDLNITEPKLNKNIQDRQDQVTGTRSTTISVDSIGSAGSFAKRNARSSSTSAKSSDLSSPASYSSAYSSSSLETAAAMMKPATSCNEPPSPESEIANKHIEQQVPPPPLPPPLPPKTLLPTTTACCKANLMALGKKSRLALSTNQATRKLDSNEPTIGMFLESHGLGDLCEVFEEEKIDLEALVLLTEEDLKSLNILLGPRRKLLKAIDEVRRKAEHRDDIREEADDTIRSIYMMVDTQL